MPGAGADNFVQAQSGITTPAAHFGFELTADGKDAMWDQEVAYYEKLAKESDRIELQVLGKNTLGRPFIMLTISSPQNLGSRTANKEISRQMADPRGLTPQQIDALAAEGRAVVLVTLGQHSTEVASAQMGPRMVHRLATRNDDQVRTILDNTIFLLIPSFNPDGQDIVGDWLKKSAGTPTKARVRRSCTAHTSATTTIATATCCRRSSRSTGRRSCITTGSRRFIKTRIRWEAMARAS